MHLPTAARATLLLAVLSLAASPVAAPTSAAPRTRDSHPARWVRRTLQRMSLEEKAAQLVVPALYGIYTPTDSGAFERLTHLARDRRVGGFHVFGGGEALPPALLNPVYGSSGRRATKADPLAVAVLLDRLQQLAPRPLLFTADLEGGAGYIVEGATRLPRAMAIAATREESLAEQAGRLAAGEGRALGVHVDFYPVVDVNSNPRNPIINVRSFGEDPALVSRMAVAYLKGIRAGGMLSTAKHFPGHGDTATDTHLDLALIEKPRAALETVELPPFEAAIAAGVDGVMSAHIRLPALDASEGVPATLSRPILTGLLRQQLGFDGLVFTDSMSMHAISRRFAPGQAAALAVEAGADVVLDPPDPDAAIDGIRDAAAAGRIPLAQLDRSVERILRAKARLGLDRQRQVDLGAVPAALGGRTRAALAEAIAARALTLLKDDPQHLPLRAPANAHVLALSLVDYDSGWREGAPGRTFIPEIEKRYPDTTAVEISDRTTAGELDLVRALARRSDLVIAATYVRIASYSGRMDLSPAQVALLEDLAGDPARPLVTVAFGNPYVASLGSKLGTLLLTYEFGDAPEAAAVRALCGEAAIGGRLPISIPGLFPFGHGLGRPAVAAPPPAAAAPR